MIAGSLGLAANAALSNPRVWPLYVFQFVISASFSIGVGAQRSMTPQLVDESHFMAASALNSVTSQFGAVGGPAFAGLAIKFVDLKWIYLGDTLSYVGAIVAVALLPRLVATENADRPSWSSIVAGFRYVRRQPVILGFFLVDTNAMIFGMPSALFPAIAAHRFGDASLVGYLYMAPAVGALLVSLLSGPNRVHAGRSRAVHREPRSRGPRVGDEPPFLDRLGRRRLRGGLSPARFGVPRASSLRRSRQC
jgi:hypothetical protein